MFITRLKIYFFKDRYISNSLQKSFASLAVRFDTGWVGNSCGY